MKTEADYEDALALLDSLMGAEPGTEDGEHLEYWAKLVEIYEGEHYPIPKPTQVEANEFAIDQAGLDPVQP